MSVRGVIFDLGGTLVDKYSLSPLKSLHYALLKHNYYFTLPQINVFMGMSKPIHIRALIIEYYREAHRTSMEIDLPLKVRPVYEDFKREQLRLLREGIEVIPGIKGTYDYLRDNGIKIGVTTGYAQEETDIIISHLREEGMEFDSVITSCQVKDSRPSPDMVLKAMNDMQIEEMCSSSVIKVDDSLYGLKEGLRGGCTTVGVARYSCMMNVMSMCRGREDVEEISDFELEMRCDRVREQMLDIGCHYAIDSVASLPSLIDSL